MRPLKFLHLMWNKTLNKKKLIRVQKVIIYFLRYQIIFIVKILKEPHNYAVLLYYTRIKTIFLYLILKQQR